MKGKRPRQTKHADCFTSDTPLSSVSVPPVFPFDMTIVTINSVSLTIISTSSLIVDDCETSISLNDQGDKRLDLLRYGNAYSCNIPDHFRAANNHSSAAHDYCCNGDDHCRFAKNYFRAANNYFRNRNGYFRRTSNRGESASSGRISGNNYCPDGNHYWRG